MAVSSSQSRLLRLSWPSVAQYLGGAVVGLVDTVALGGISPEDQGAVGFSAFLFWFIEMMPLAFFTAMQLKVAKTDRPNAEVSALTWRGAKIGFALGVVLTAMIHLGARQALELMHVDAELIPYCVEYLEVRGLGLPLVLAGFAFAAAHRGRGFMRLILVIGICTTMINSSLDYILVYGFGPIQPLAATFGVAVASLVAPGIWSARFAGRVPGGFWPRAQHPT